MEQWKDKSSNRPMCRGCGKIIPNTVDYYTMGGHGIDWYFCEVCINWLSPKSNH